MATLCTGPVWADHTQDGRRFSLRHLHPAIRHHRIASIAPSRRKRGRSAMTVAVRILYSHHCFTQALEKVVHAHRDHHYNCTRRPRDRRVFCAVRWNESLALPAIVAGIEACYFTRHHNYFVWRDPTDASLDPYFVYFSVRRRDRFVEIEIESAYPRADAAEATKAARRVSLTTLIVNAANGRRTHAPPA